MTLEQLWAGWRAEFLNTSASGDHSGGSCVFCALLGSQAPRSETLIVATTQTSLVVLNLYPYVSGHLLVMPQRHVGDLAALSTAEGDDLWSTIRRAHATLQRAYQPDGFNVGANLGRAAGAGIPDHAHFHVLPRWTGDTNFTTTIAGTRVIPETLQDTWNKVTYAWEQVG